MPQKIITLCLLFSIIFHGQAQDVKFGKVSEEALRETTYPADSTAAAAVLYRKVRVYYQYVQSQGFQLKTEVHERIKMYKKEGFDYATKTEKLYTGGSKSDKERLSGLKAVTYNLKGPRVEETKLKGSQTFTKELSKYYDEISFTMPNVTEGSIIEYMYNISSPYYTTIDEIVLQYDIPIKYQNVMVSIPEYFVFAPKIKGYLTFQPQKSTKQGRINYQNKSRGGGNLTVTTTYQTGSVSFTENVSEVIMENVPALVQEPYVNNMDNYRSAVNYELQYVKLPNSPIESYTTNWQEVAKKIYDSDNFGRQLEQRRYFKDALAQATQGATSEKEKIFRIFDLVRNHMNWNSYYGKYTDLGVKKAFNEKAGNVADINLMLVAMLNEAGITSNPVLVSTRDNGVPLFPTREGFNYVVASAKVGGQTVLMDASNKFALPNLLPTRALNWTGLLIGEDGMSTPINMQSQISAATTKQMIGDISLDGTVNGQMRTTYSGYGAYMFRNNHFDQEEASYIEGIENEMGAVEVDGYSIEHKGDLGKDIRESYKITIADMVDVIGDKIYFNPLFFESQGESPFKLDERKYPVDFVTPWEDKLQFMIKFPEGYSLESKPENVKFSLPNGAGQFTYMASETATGLQIMSVVKINQAIFPATQYAALKEFFKKLVEKQNEKVVLTKM
ncbi:MAG: transglutaminase domain-containing protein [Flavobacteriaceae bacterium]